MIIRSFVKQATDDVDDETFEGRNGFRANWRLGSNLDRSRDLLTLILPSTTPNAQIGIHSRSAISDALFPRLACMDYR